MKSIRTLIKEKPWVGWLLFVATVIVVFLLGLLASEITERRAEAVYVNKPKVEISDYEPRNEVWGANYPKQFQSYMKTRDTSFRSKYNGSAFIDELEEDPRLVILWAGYGFSKEYNQGRGHYYAIKDIREILRTGAPIGERESPMPNTCWTCKSPDVPRVMNEVGVAEFYKGSWEERGHQIVNPIGCADCHNPETMNLRITRPALIEAFQRQGKDVKNASHQEMRTLVCAQCHVEYYFKGEGKYLTFPWDNGTKPEEIEAYYDETGFYDWIHPISKAPMLKAQHPGYEVFTTGIHYDRGVSCADCHMPYHSEGGQKFTNHHMQSPLNNISESCQVCHRQSEEKLLQNVYNKQKSVRETRFKLEDALVKAHIEAGEAWDAGATEKEMKPILTAIRHAQWRWDYAAAGHGNSFHSALELSRTMASGLDAVQEARLLLARILTKYGVEQPVTMPDISTKAKAQEYVGWNMEKLNRQKEKFLEEVVPQWVEKAAQREKEWGVDRL
ncbi:MAG: ammonia-forming cytochrome c nitrite reductase [Bacteroidales bacterium]|nr:ammonia-forming cytochrome c nitrite reductase [Bacteroidales bacterium]